MTDRGRHTDECKSFARGGMREIVFYPASEWERFQMRIRKLTITDVSDIIEMHNISILLNEKEGAVTLLVPSNE